MSELSIAEKKSQNQKKRQFEILFKQLYTKSYPFLIKPNPLPINTKKIKKVRFTPAIKNSLVKKTNVGSEGEFLVWLEKSFDGLQLADSKTVIHLSEPNNDITWITQKMGDTLKIDGACLLKNKDNDSD